MVTSDSRSIVTDYVFYKLNKKGLPWPNAPPLPPPTDAHRLMRELGDKFEERYKEQFDEMGDQLHLTPDTAYQKYHNVVAELFREGVRWGRLVALVAFTGACTVTAVEREMPQFVDRYVDWTVQYIDNNLAQWLQENGGWVDDLAGEQVTPPGLTWWRIPVCLLTVGGDKNHLAGRTNDGRTCCVLG
ncbi:BCL2L2 [Branchiostoma lanceolatum]|uniref:BCL2L2 protein n=1 Tax=Branchiostoma lanceolatum TaxID=7740 RepID=A0A8J9YRV3_BRALA|nr:BCL2L2 [Branchiostoma lanceolatum]